MKMKTKNLFFAMLMAPAIFTACSNEDFIDQTAKEGEAISGKDVTLVLQGDADTRMVYEPGEENNNVWSASAYKWQLPGAAPTAANAIDKLGLCRVMNNMATTNYLFFPTAVRSQGQLNWVTDVNAEGTGAKFSTENLTLFTGNYIAYYPYSEAVVNDGPIKLSLKQAQVQDATAGQEADHVAANGFAISDPIELEGGKVVDANFTLQQLYSTIYVRLKGNVNNFISVSLESDNEIFPVEATLDVTKLSGKKASELTAEDLTVTKKVSHIDLTLNAAQNLTGNYQTYYMTLMPGTYTGVKVVYRTQSGYKVEALAGAITTKPGSFLDLTRTLDGSTFTPYSISDNIIVNDASSWTTAVAGVALVSNTTKTIMVNAPIKLDATNKLFVTDIDASASGKVIVKGESITVPASALGTAKFQNVIFENKVILGETGGKTDLTVPAGANITFNDLEGVIDNTGAKSGITVTGQATTATVLNLKNATIPGDIVVGDATASTLAALNVIDGGTLTTYGKVDFPGTSTDNLIHIQKGATWNIENGDVLGTNEGKLMVEGAMNQNAGTFNIVATKGACDFTNGTVTINSGKFNVGEELEAKRSNPNVAGTITNKGGIVYVTNTLFNDWAKNGKSASFKNNAGEYYVLGFKTSAALTKAMGEAAAGTGYKQATGFELAPSAAETWEISDVNAKFNYDLLLNATTAAITMTMPDNATCTVNGDLIINGTTNAVTINKKTAASGASSSFSVNNIVVGAGGKLTIGTSAYNPVFKVTAKSCYVANGAEFGFASNLVGCTPSGDGVINK